MPEKNYKPTRRSTALRLTDDERKSLKRLAVELDFPIIDVMTAGLRLMLNPENMEVLKTQLTKDLGLRAQHDTEE